MPDPIRSALHAAALATMTASEREHSETCHNGEPGPGHIRRAAETVAAFLLRAADTHAGCYAAMEPREMLKHIAAAVEKAARDE